MASDNKFWGKMPIQWLFIAIGCYNVVIMYIVTWKNSCIVTNDSNRDYTWGTVKKTVSVKMTSNCD